MKKIFSNIANMEEDVIDKVYSLIVRSLSSEHGDNSTTRENRTDLQLTSF